MQVKLDFAGHVAMTKDNRGNARILQWRPRSGARSRLDGMMT